MPPGGIKIVLAGTDSYFNLVLQQFIEFLSSRSPEWITYFLFLLVPLGEKRNPIIFSLILRSNWFFTRENEARTASFVTG